MLSPSERNTVRNHPLAVLWFDDGGILHKVSKSVPRTTENVKDLYAVIRKMTNGKKVCAMIEVSKEAISMKETRELLKEEIPKTFSALAIITSTPLGQMIGILLTVLAPTHIPAKVFSNVDDAKEWLREHEHLCGSDHD